MTKPSMQNQIQFNNNTQIQLMIVDFDGLDETGSRVLNQVNHGIRQRSKEYISNNLAIVANMLLLLEKFGLKMH
ncbi:hypothetical protein SLEP1_g22794 [Rubroshorea leprosula]|uniref:STAS domain-containing protein n=1 Tax=Rubroshorea leprosula TaxID=152421 RepID=A0AAV5JKP2_9ROSI|nr:hypothetical protein SLEP1_g22794 [Rubroshorea leprosula]